MLMRYSRVFIIFAVVFYFSISFVPLLFLFFRDYLYFCSWLVASDRET